MMKNFLKVFFAVLILFVMISSMISCSGRNVGIFFNNSPRIDRVYYGNESVVSGEVDWFIHKIVDVDVAKGVNTSIFEAFSDADEYKNGVYVISSTKYAIDDKYEDSIIKGKVAERAEYCIEVEKTNYGTSIISYYSFSGTGDKRYAVDKNDIVDCIRKHMIEVPTDEVTVYYKNQKIS